MNKLNFETKLFNEGTIKAHVSGIYKCVKYGDKYFAYYKPKSWKNWGNSCFHTNRGEAVSYSTLARAKKACNEHYIIFEGKQPYSNIGTIKQ